MSIDKKCPIFVLKTKKDFVFKLNKDHNIKTTPSKFDSLLQHCWETSRDKGAFNYKIEELPTKTLPGLAGFVVQLNKYRSQLKRKAVRGTITSLSQSFDHTRFNFTKIKEEEMLFNFDTTSLQTEDTSIEDSSTKSINAIDASLNNAYFSYDLKASIIINNAPICYGHSLVLPQLDQCRPQVIDKEGLAICVYLMLLSNTVSMKIGFNSLCANATVNHYHYHLYYLDHRLPIEDVKVIHLAGDCFVLCSYFCNGFAFQLENEDVLRLINNVMKLLNILTKHEIPHNLCITRGTSFQCTAVNEPSSVYDTVRICVFARTSSLELPENSYYVSACNELNGHVAIYDDETWDAVKEEDIKEVMYTACKNLYHKIIPLVTQEFSN